MSKEAGLILVTPVLANKRPNSKQKLLPVCPKTALGKRKRKKIVIANFSALHANTMTLLQPNKESELIHKIQSSINQVE